MPPPSHPIPQALPPSPDKVTGVVANEGDGNGVVKKVKDKVKSQR